MSWKSRIVGHDRVDPETLTGNPKNHRTHPQSQRNVVRDSISEFGFVKSVLVNKRTGFIVDGHERVWQALDAKQTDPSVEIDVEYVDLSESEEAAVLAILDASTEMAVVDPVKLDELIRDVQIESESIVDLLAEMSGVNVAGGETTLIEVAAKPFPVMSWVLIGIETVNFGRISQAIDTLAEVDGLIMETVVSDVQED